MTIINRPTATLLTAIMCVGLGACTSIKNTTQTPTKLVFDGTQYRILVINVDGKSVPVRAFENIPYVAKPTEPEYQLMNVYVPESYFRGESINGYTADTAPIFFPNGVGGYMPAKPMTPTLKDDTPNSVMVALSLGYVVASAGARGRTLGADGRYTGKAPAVIIDLKSAVRYLYANDALMAGRADRIISSGTSAGGAVSALLGASGASDDFVQALADNGAVMGVPDTVFAVSAYCPITNLDKADMAYEWQFNGINTYQKMHISMLDYAVKRERIWASLSDDQKRWSQELKVLFPSYVNGLKLTGHDGRLLSLDKDGNGSFKEEVIYHLNRSVNRAFKRGVSLDGVDFLAQHKSAMPYYVADFDKYNQQLGRGKGVPAFDGVDLSSGENSLFGGVSTNHRHFTTFAQKYGQGTMAEPQTIKMMNAMNYLANSPTQHWRIRHGTKDNDTSLAVPVILATALNNHGKAVDFELVWDKGHGGDYDLDELFLWADGVVKSAL